LKINYFLKIFFRLYCEEQKSHCGSKKKALPLHSTDLTRTLSQEKEVEFNHLLIACKRDFSTLQTFNHQPLVANEGEIDL
jgi:hypothetical protein